MDYYFSKTIDHAAFADVIDKVTQALATEGFGVLTQIDVRETFKKKLDVDFRNYKILGACNPGFAHKALRAEDKIGAFLPCNVIVQELDNGTIEVAAVDPVASMASVDNPELGPIAAEVRQKLQRVIDIL
jgi:uncharacterized protein (DUF302 family)